MKGSLIYRETWLKCMSQCLRVMTSNLHRPHNVGESRCSSGTPGPLHQILLWLNSGASSSLLTDPNTERKNMATGSRLLVGTARNKSWLLKSALICVSWRGDCLLGPVVTLLYQPVLLASSLPAWRSPALPFFPSFLCFALSHTGMCTNMHANTRSQIHIHTFFCQTHSLPVFLSHPLLFFSLSIFLLTSTDTNSLSSRTSISRHIIWIRLWVAVASHGLSPQSPSSRSPF